jgi:hypothetical protein
MQQRQPRLGDVVDDYCPRERRVTNHAIVAMVGDQVRLTRCTTCDAEHDYKQARVPPQRKKKDASGALYQQVLDGATPARVVPVTAAAVIDAPPEPEMTESFEGPGDAPPSPDSPPTEHEGPVHRRLIRATLPRLPGTEPPARREPEFTMRAPAQHRHGKPKGGGFRGPRPPGQGASPSQPDGNRAGGKRHGRGEGQGQGGWSRPGPQGGGGRPGGPRQGRGGKKRSR